MAFDQDRREPLRGRKPQHPVQVVARLGAADRDGLVGARARVYLSLLTGVLERRAETGIQTDEYQRLLARGAVHRELPRT